MPPSTVLQRHAQGETSEASAGRPATGLPGTVPPHSGAEPGGSGAASPPGDDVRRPAEAEASTGQSPGTSSSAASPPATGRSVSLPVTAPVTGAALTLLDRACDSLRQAAGECEPDARYLAAHLAGLRAATAVLAVRGRPAGRRTGPPRSVWRVLPRLAPELAEWAELFAALAPARGLATGARQAPVEPRVADDLLRDAECFCRVVTELLGLPWEPVLPDVLPASG